MSADAEPINILLVEDDENDIFFFERALSQAGVNARVRVQRDGAQAMDYLKAVQGGNQPAPDMIFLDLKMPNVNGFEVLAWLREQSFGGALKVLVLTSSVLPKDMDTAISLGADKCFTKPISPEALRDLLAA